MHFDQRWSECDRHASEPERFVQQSNGVNHHGHQNLRLDILYRLHGLRSGAVLENNKRLDGSLTRLLSNGGFFAGLAVLGLIMALKPIKPQKPPDEASVENTISN
jgi:hypothetical protein